MTIGSNERDLVPQRGIPFARALVLKALTDPEHVTQWWGPDGFRSEGATTDFRVGGAWTFNIVRPDGTRYPNHSNFKEITPQSRLVFNYSDGEQHLAKLAAYIKANFV
jgi:uncharacterized protein YndB with AHSA1/START domain